MLALVQQSFRVLRVQRVEFRVLCFVVLNPLTEVLLIFCLTKAAMQEVCDLVVVGAGEYNFTLAYLIGLVSDVNHRRMVWPRCCCDILASSPCSQHPRSRSTSNDWRSMESRAPIPRSEVEQYAWYIRVSGLSHGH